jgi:PAS domain S-box-containing protein
LTQPDSAVAGQPTRWHAFSQRYASGLLVVLVGIGATLIAAYLQYRARSSEAREAFSAWCEEEQQQLTRTIDSNIEVLYGMRALFDSSTEVRPQEFQRYAADAAARHVHLRSLGFLQHVAGADRARFEAQMSAQLGETFQITDPVVGGGTVRAPERPEYLPLVYVQKEDGLPAGVDAMGNPEMPRVIETLRHTSGASAVVATIEDGGRVRTFVHVYLPVYAHNGDSQNARGAPYGYVRVRFVPGEMARGTMEAARQAGIAVSLTVPEGAGGQDREGRVREEFADGQRFIWTGTIAFADRGLQLEFRTTPAFEAMPDWWSAWPTLLIGTLLTGLGACGAYSLANSRMRLQLLAEDLTVQVRERQLSEQRYRVLVENSPDCILLFRNQRAVFVNQSGVELFGAAAADELLGRGTLDLLDPEFREESQRRLDRILAEHTILTPFEARVLRLDGTRVDVEIRSVPYFVDGEFMLQVVVRDITARLRAERERAGLEAALRQSQRLEAIGTFTGGIAHDFNNILSSIVGNIQLLLDDLPGAHPARQSAHEIRNATNRARELVKRLMAFSREQEAPLTAVALQPIVEEVRQLLRPTMPAGVLLDCYIPADLPPVLANATQLHQMLVNLCTNGWLALPSGQGRIDLRVSAVNAVVARRQSRTALDGAERYVCIEVTDNGSGMEQRILDRVFEPFFTTKGASEGSGLGLAVVHGIVQSHKGAIRAVSQAGDGTSFFIYLPASAAALPGAAHTPEQPATCGNQHILYVDDEEPLVFLVTRMLERSGYRCTGTTDPQQAVDAVRHDPQGYDLVVTDMNMPGMSGLDVARQVLAVRPDLPVLITTGYVRASDMALMRQTGARDLVLKPDTIEELTKIVARYLRPE